MGFMSPKPPKQKPPANPAIAAQQPPEQRRGITDYSSFISTAAQGLKRRASTQRTSLIGGG